MIPGIVAQQALLGAGGSVDIYPTAGAAALSSPATGTSHSVTVSASAGQRSIVFIVASSQIEPMFPAGWTTIVNQLPTGGWAKVAYRDYQAGDPSSITVTTSSSLGIVAHCLNINAGTFNPSVAPIYNSFSYSSTATPDPFALTDPAGVRPKMAIAWCGYDGNTALSSGPSNMVFEASNSRGTPFASSRLFKAETSAASFDPATFTLAAAVASAVATIFIVGFPA